MPLKKHRNLSGIPSIKGFKPLALPMNLEDAIQLELDEYEALKLMDYEGMIHEQAAQAMHVSRPTLSRIYDSARKKVARAFVEGKGILIQGGAVSIDQKTYRCTQCGHQFQLDPVLHESDCLCPSCQSSEIVPVSQCFSHGCGFCKKCFT